MKKTTTLLIFFTLILIIRPLAFSHCEVPCGIYNDKMRFNMIEEHITTIEKALNQIIELSQQSPQNYNQIVRWVVNKEHHAEEIQHIISQYFLTQRLKPIDKKEKEAYQKLRDKIAFCHEILVYAMKTKQSTDLSNVQNLKSSVKKFSNAYFESTN